MTEHSEDPRQRLTEKQLRCLRLVHLGTSKKIAQQVGLSWHTVNGHINAAMAKLGAADRHEAAALVRSWDLREATNQELVGQPQPVDTGPAEVLDGRARTEPGRAATERVDILREERVPYGFRRNDVALGGWAGWLAGEGKQHGAARLGIIVKTVFFSLAALLVLFAVSESLLRTLHIISPNAS